QRLAMERQRIRGQRIVELDLPALAVHEPTEVAIAHGFRRHRVLIRRVGNAARCFPGEEEERAVAAVINLRNEDRSTERNTVLVAVEERRLRERVLPAASDTITAVAIGLKQRAVIVVGSALAR